MPPSGRRDGQVASGTGQPLPVGPVTPTASPPARPGGQSALAQRLAELRAQLQVSTLYRPKSDPSPSALKRTPTQNHTSNGDYIISPRRHHRHRGSPRSRHRRREERRMRREGDPRHESSRYSHYANGGHRRHRERGTSRPRRREERRERRERRERQDEHEPMQAPGYWGPPPVTRQEDACLEEEDDDEEEEEEEEEQEQDECMEVEERSTATSNSGTGYGYGYGYGQGRPQSQPRDVKLQVSQPQQQLQQTPQTAQQTQSQRQQELKQQLQQRQQAAHQRLQQQSQQQASKPVEVSSMKAAEGDEEEDLVEDEPADESRFRQQKRPASETRGQRPEVVLEPNPSAPLTPDLPDFGGDDDEDEDDEGAEASSPANEEGPTDGNTVEDVAHMDPYELADSDDGEFLAALERAARDHLGDAEEGEIEEETEDVAEAPPPLASPTPASPQHDTPPKIVIEAIRANGSTVPSAAPVIKAPAATTQTAIPKASTVQRPAVVPQKLPIPAAGSAPSAPSRPAKKPRVVNDSALMAGWQALIARTKRHPDYAAEYTSLFNNDGKNWLKATSQRGRFVLGIDCEMVYAKDDANALARVSVVSCTGVIYDAHVQKKPEEVLDYRSRISGVESHHLLAENGALPFEEVQQQVLQLISSETILVGHSLHKDLRALKIQHLKIVDTALIFSVEGNHRRKHKLNSLVTLMRPKVATLSPVRPGAHDPRQDAQWALQLALYEASIHPRTTQPLKLLSFPKTIFLSEIPHNTSSKELQGFFARGVCQEVVFHLQSENVKSGEWLGTTTVTFPSVADRDTAFAALPRFVRVYVGPMRDWAGRTDTARMQALLVEHFAKFGRVRSCRVMCPRSFPGQPALPFGLLECHPTAARAILTDRKAHSFAGHRSNFKLSIADEDTQESRCAVPLPKVGSFLAKLG